LDFRAEKAVIFVKHLWVTVCNFGIFCATKAIIKTFLEQFRAPDLCIYVPTEESGPASGDAGLPSLKKQRRKSNDRSHLVRTGFCVHDGLRVRRGAGGGIFRGDLCRRRAGCEAADESAQDVSAIGQSSVTRQKFFPSGRIIKKSF
jgi:hypothetical protein